MAKTGTGAKCPEILRKLKAEEAESGRELLKRAGRGMLNAAVEEPASTIAFCNHIRRCGAMLDGELDFDAAAARIGGCASAETLEKLDEGLRYAMAGLSAAKMLRCAMNDDEDGVVKNARAFRDYVSTGAGVDDATKYHWVVDEIAGSVHKEAPDELSASASKRPTVRGRGLSLTNMVIDAGFRMGGDFFKARKKLLGDPELVTQHLESAGKGRYRVKFGQKHEDAIREALDAFRITYRGGRAARKSTKSQGDSGDAENAMPLSKYIMSAGLARGGNLRRASAWLLEHDGFVSTHLDEVAKGRYRSKPGNEHGKAIRDALRAYKTALGEGRKPPVLSAASAGAPSAGHPETAESDGCTRRYPLGCVAGFLGQTGRGNEETKKWLLETCGDYIKEGGDGLEIGDEHLLEIMKKFDGVRGPSRQGSRIQLMQAVTQAGGKVSFADAMDIVNRYQGGLVLNEGSKSYVRDSDMWKLRLILSQGAESGDILIPLDAIYGELLRKSEGSAAVTDYLRENPVTYSRMVERSGKYFVHAGNDLSVVGRAIQGYRDRL